jgi:hypothetical protein
MWWENICHSPALSHQGHVDYSKSSKLNLKLIFMKWVRIIKTHFSWFFSMICWRRDGLPVVKVKDRSAAVIGHLNPIFDYDRNVGVPWQDTFTLCFI